MPASEREPASQLLRRRSYAESMALVSPRRSRTRTRMLLPWLAYSAAVALIVPAQGHDEGSGSTPLPAEGPSAALDQMLQALMRDPSFAAERHAGVLVLGCLQEPRGVDSEIFFLAARRLTKEFVLRHTFDAELCAARGIPLGSLAVLVASDLHRPEEDICESGGIKRKCEEPHVALDLLQTAVIPLQKKTPGKMADEAYAWAHQHRAPLVGVATPENLATTYSSRPLALLFATVGFGGEREIEATHFWHKKFAAISHYYENTNCTFAIADKVAMADEAAKFGLSHLDVDDMREVGLGIIDDLKATATHPPSFAAEDYAWLVEDGSAGWERAPGTPEPSVPITSPARFKAELGEAWDERKVLEFVRGFISAKQFRESYGTNPDSDMLSEESLYPSMSENSKKGGTQLILSQKRSAAYKKRLRLAKEQGLMDLVGSLVPAALAAKRDYSNFAAGETILAVSAPDDSAAGHSCGERCARLNHVMRELAAGLKQHAPQLVEENKLLLAVMDGSRNALPPGIPDPAAKLGAPVDLRYPAVYITRRGHEDIDEVVDPEFFHPNVTLVSRLLPETTAGHSSTGAWSPWHLLKFVAQHAPEVGVTEELLAKVK